MKTATVNFLVHGDHKNVQTISGHYKDEFETKQIVSYTIENNVALIVSVTPAIATNLKLQLPLHVPIRDLGSGRLRDISFDADTLTATTSTCPSMQWASLRDMQTPLTTYQTLLADRVSL